MEPTTSTPRIAIIGAGPSGLTLARILHVNNVSVTVFEREDSPAARPQGGTLDLKPRTGQAALAKAQLTAEFEAHCRHEGEDMTVVDRTGKVWADVRGQARGKPEIDRLKLREILLNSLPQGMIRWGSNLRGATVDPATGRGTLKFEHGIEDGWDLIVGADGAWSKIRPLLTPVNPFYSGISGVELRLSDIDQKNPDLSEFLGRGSFFAFGEEQGRVLLCQRNGDGSVKIYAVGWKPESWIKDNGIDFNDAQRAREAILKDYEGWDSTLRELISRCDDIIVPRAMYMLPVGLRWSSRKGVTVMGDAAHLMTPFAGEGVNVAMADAMILAENIIKYDGDVNTAAAEYEKWMHPTSMKMTDKTWQSLLDRFRAGGVEQFGARVNSTVAAEAEIAKANS